LKIKGKMSILLILLLCFSLVLTACGAKQESSKEKNEVSGQEEEKKVKFRFAHVMPIDHPEHEAAIRMANLLKEKTNGRITVEVYPASQLGGSRELMTSVINGTVEMVSTSTFGTINSNLLVVELPYLFKNFDHVSKFTKSEMSKQLLESLNGQGVHGMGFWTVGFRNIGNTKRLVEKPEDLKGLLIRAFENEMLKDTLNALGANVTVLPYPEVYMALQTGTIDGEENPYVNTYAMKFFEPEKYKTETRHLNNFEIVVSNIKWWDSLAEKDQEIIMETFNEATEFYMELQKEADLKYKQLLIDEGMKVTEISDYQPWIAAVKPVYDKWEPKLGKELIEKIRSLGW